MNDFRFAQPQWIHLLWAILLLGLLLVWRELRGRAALNSFLSDLMQARLVYTTSGWRRFSALACLLLSLVALVLAMMRPQWGATQRVLPRMGAQIMVCMDVSKSMLAEDTVPNRLERAKAELTDLLDLMKGEQVGLIAFAGKATVISPLTSDFGFLKLMLEHVAPQSVGRGGTRLEEPIRKALGGFGATADISRVILLITDGEDHDSFPLEAAAAAREQGVKIITVGFGDEAGSKIEITDPRTGVRSFIVDASGNPVISRLDGELLREIALETEGAYIPAGTGALDLISIHRRHIVPLVRGNLESGTQILRNEAYQWMVLGGLGLLCIALMITRGVRRMSTRDGTLWRFSGKAAAVLLLSMVPVATPAVHAQTGQGESNATEDSNVESQSSQETLPNPLGSEASDDASERVDPRSTFNESLALMQTDADRAETLLQQARRHAGTDGEVRFRAAYNLGWLEVSRADVLLKEQPAEALEHLRAAADWFRRAIRVRPKNLDARHNLEIVMRRTLELADALAQRNRPDVATRLDELIARQRGLVAQAGALVERVEREDNSGTAAEIFRRDFREVATAQRQLLSETQALAQQVGEELDALQDTADQQVPQQQVRAAQLQAVASYLPRATQRMGQARSQFRRRQDQRGFRRAALSLDELKRARDMLRPPQEILQRLLTDTRTLLDQTQVLATEEREVVGPQQGAPSPPWLTKEFLEQSQQSLTERTTQWAEQMRLAFQGEDPQVESPRDTAAAHHQELLWKQSPELVASAATSFDSAEQAIRVADFDMAADQQAEAYERLAEARELFLDLKSLIEVACATQEQIAQVVQALPGLTEDQQRELGRVAGQLQHKNLARSDRLADEIEAQRQQVEIRDTPDDKGTAGDSGTKVSPGTPPAQRDAEVQRLKIASQLLTAARERMQRVDRELENSATSSAAGPDAATSAEDAPDGAAATPKAPSAPAGGQLGQLAEDTAAAVDRWQELRRLFFTIAEHLRESAQRQADVNDRTQALTAVTEAETRQQQLVVLSAHQGVLRETSAQIADALREQAQQLPAAAGAAGSEEEQQARQVSARFAEAARHVEQATEAMRQAQHVMDDEAAELPSIRQHQDAALSELLKALALLMPPDQQNNDEQEAQTQPQEGEPQTAAAQDQQPDENMSANQLLQMIRDREAQRRRDRGQQAAGGGEPVDKDW